LSGDTTIFPQKYIDAIPGCDPDDPGTYGKLGEESYDRMMG
jgi:hypothetical protein